MPSIKQQIETILSITCQFEEFYQQEQWDELSSALDTRQKYLNALFAQEISATDRSIVLEAIQKIQASDSNYESKIIHIRNGAKNELFKFKKQNNAAKSYATINQSN